MKHLFFALFSLFFACQESSNSMVSAVAASAPVQATSPSATPAPLPNEERDYLLGRFNPASREDFVKLGAPYSDREKMMLRKECFEAFKKMHEAAAKEGLHLKIISSTRTFAQQKTIWEGKWSRFAKDAPEAEARSRKILEYSSMPGSSRHHWGTDIDLNDLNNPAFEAGGKYEKEYLWLTAHAHEYGFCQPYTAGRPSGYFEEKWHWSYTPLSKNFLETWKNQIEDKDIQGFLGSETAQSIGIKKHYVLGINEGCK